MQPRRARRTDANHSEIAVAFEKSGFSVHRTNGDWDLTVGYGGITILVEVKDGKKPPSARKLTPREATFHATWTGGIRLITCVDDVLAAKQTMLADADAIRKARLFTC